MKSKKPLLALDTATNTATVSVLDMETESVLAHKDAPVRTHGKALATLILETLEMAETAPMDLTGVGCGAGPGSFTGIRIGLATAKGICLPNNIPLAMISSLDALACRIAEDYQATVTESSKTNPHCLRSDSRLESNLISPCLDARRGEVFISLVRMINPFNPQKILPPQALAPSDAVHAIIQAAEACDLIFESAFRADSKIKVQRILEDPIASLSAEKKELFVFTEAEPWPSSVAIGKMAIRKIKAGKNDDPATAQPIYLRPSDAEKNFKVNLSPGS